MMKSLFGRSMLRRLVHSPVPTRLGRWGTSTDAKIIERKVALANHDHCGPCPPLKRSKPFKPLEDSSIDMRLSNEKRWDNMIKNQYISEADEDNFDNSMDISLCALQSLHSYPRHLSS